jgi:penicillin-binding protein 1B
MWVGLGLLLLTVAILGGGYLLKLDREIASRFEGRRWRLPSKIYSDTFSLYTGGPFKGSHILNRLRRLGYQPSKQGSPRKGEYRTGRGFMEIHLHDFLYPQGSFEGFPVRLETVEGTIERLRDLREPDKEIFSVDLEPELITGLFEQVWEERRLVSLSDVPEHTVDAVIAVEDRRFYEHFGIDFPSIARALLANIEAGRIVQGASTLTQQLVKNFYLTPKRTLSRKTQEALMALLLEVRYTKEQILEAYLNEIYFGQRGSQGVYGVGEAAEFYFGKPVRKLRLEESAVLAGLIRSPILYSPHKDTDRIRKRRDRVLKMMWGLGMISEDQYNEATEAPVEVRAFHPERNDAPYFVDHLMKELEKEYSLDILTSEGLLIFTTLDVEMQNEARRTVKQGLRRLEARDPSLKPSSSQGPQDALQACLVAIEPQTGFIRAMIGGRDYKQSQFNRVTQARRQPGSLFKPIVYVTALEGGVREPAFTAASLVQDEPIRIRYEGKSWSPKNFNDQFFGRVTVRTALENSLNCATVWLSQRVGLAKVIDTAQSLGLTSPMEPEPSLVLGAFETAPLEMAFAFGAFANHGVLTKPRAVKKVLDKEGNLLERRPMELEQAISPEVAYLITSLLKGVFERGTARSVSSRIRVPAAGKTGTTNDNRDAWFAGYTPRLAALVWVGYDKPRSIGRTGSQAALPIWADFIGRASDWLVTEDFVPPSGIVFAEVDRMSGGLATRACTDRITEAFLVGTEPTESCDLHSDETVEDGLGERSERNVFRKVLDWFR